LNEILGRVCASNCYLEPLQQVIGEILTHVKFIVHLKDKYENNVDFISIFAEQRKKQHELFCFPQSDANFVDYFFAFARFGNSQNVPVKMQFSYPLVTLKHEILTHEASSLLVFFAVNTGNSLFLHKSKMII
jgi:hypothetical protein